MAQNITIADALERIAGTRATARMDDDRASIILDVTGLDEAQREALEADVRAAALAVPGVATVRVAQTSQRTARRIVAVASGKGGVGNPPSRPISRLACTRSVGASGWSMLTFTARPSRC